MYPAHGNYTLDSIGEIIIVRFIEQWNTHSLFQRLNGLNTGGLRSEIFRYKE